VPKRMPARVVTEGGSGATLDPFIEDARSNLSKSPCRNALRTDTLRSRNTSVSREETSATMAVDELLRPARSIR
jgi:hypothetical protein